ncbi:ADP-ribosylglycohydrolase family protein [Acrocarpospora corrugata]|nr:ADP-ribosylglycohydrolase family protein [Acrocarpospora corrugata]
MSADPLARAAASLSGLALGDALGSQFADPDKIHYLDQRTLPPPPWRWTDDTEMACSLFRVLADHGRIDQDALAAAFAAHHDPARGYGAATGRMLGRIRAGGDWRSLAAGQFGGQGSWGNGAAMRVAPLGAWFGGDPAIAAAQARLSAEVTHTHPEAAAGAMAVAVATSIAVAGDRPSPAGFLGRILPHLPPSEVADKIVQAGRLLGDADPVRVAAVLGNGSGDRVQDTVPLTLWAAARHLDDYERAVWTTARAGGDVDTTCAIVGGIVGVRAGSLPADWSARVEPLPNWARGPVPT